MATDSVVVCAALTLGEARKKNATISIDSVRQHDGNIGDDEIPRSPDRALDTMATPKSKTGYTIT